jgi:hypothetical protein
MIFESVHGRATAARCTQRSVLGSPEVDLRIETLETDQPPTQS